VFKADKIVIVFKSVFKKNMITYCKFSKKY